MTRISIDAGKLLELVRDGRTNADIAAELGCTVRTIDRRRAADPSLTQAIIAARSKIAADNQPQHGTVRRYAIGCRCRACTDANTIRCRNERLARRDRLGMAPPDPSRGRPRSVADTVTNAPVYPPSTETLIAQALARGEFTSTIMRKLDVDYAAVTDVRAQLTEAVAS